ncbi:hypothetical protein [Chitinivorax sp. B]|uniref:hypothetical protein n=1 Tax=Chitinivorax sp. B TaxID=2502235 RepID=UPI0010F91EFC|nr:hypothetical protein [Chitinivorax sp. B]
MAFVTVFLTALLISPPVLYWLGLSGAQGLPAKPVLLASKEQQLLVWRKARGIGSPKVHAMNPYSVVIGLLSPSANRTDPGELVAWWVASGYLLEHQRHRGMIWWHLSGTALTIWLSRNWSCEELLSAAALPDSSARSNASFNGTT